jgi:hypothetical protein
MRQLMLLAVTLLFGTVLGWSVNGRAARTTRPAEAPTPPTAFRTVIVTQPDESSPLGRKHHVLRAFTGDCVSADRQPPGTWVITLTGDDAPTTTVTAAP